MESSGLEFGQSERLTVCLRRIIRSYPRGVGILKEFIQNADDSGASQLTVVMDWRHHEGRRLPDLRMSRLMGPALLLVNDRRFTSTDLEAICRIGEGSKAHSAPKTGRFGVGFNTAYNITDYPSFLTNDAIYCFDPHRSAVAAPTGYGREWKLEKLWKDASDWPAVFHAGGLKRGATDFAGTVFRLPLRNEETAGESEICTEPFTDEDFRTLVALALEAGSELLLFTKNLLDLTIREIEPDGTSHTRLRVWCTNADEVQRARAGVLEAVGGKLPDLLHVWSESRESLPVARYRQRFQIEGAERRTEIWEVVNGLWRGDQDCILDAAREMAKHDEKAVPWVGVAARIEEEPFAVRRCHGRLFCGLPLPVAVTLPVHVNGYFDLDDSSRQRLTTEAGNTGDDVKARIRWNRVLLEDGVARAWASLVEGMAPKFPDGFYEIWPDPSALTDLFGELSANIYRRVAAWPLIRVQKAGKIDRIPATELCLPPPSWREELHAPLVADGIPLPEPPLPAHVEHGYSGVIGELTPEDVRRRLRVDRDLATPLDVAPRACLKERAWIEALLRFCRHDGKEDLVGLPLAFLCDGRLHTFGFNSAGLIFIATEEQRRLFEKYPHWFLDPKFEAATQVKPVESAKLFRMDVEGVIVNLHHIVTNAVHRAWKPLFSEPPNSDWVAHLLEYFSSHRLSDKHLKALAQVPFIPASDGQLHAPGHPAAPLLRRAGEDQQQLVQVLCDLGIPVVEPTRKLAAAFTKFVTSCPTLFTEISGAAVVQRLHAKRESLGLTRQQAETLLDFLSEQRWSYNGPIIRQLKELALYPIERGLVSLVERGVYQPTGFQPPAVGLKTHLLEQTDRWAHLYRLLGVQHLEQRRFLTEMLLPALPDLPDENRWRAWDWIRDSFWGQVQRDDEQPLRELLASVDGVRATDGKLHAVRDLYDPRSKIIADVLGDTVLYPDLTSHKDKENWLRFFGELGLIKHPRPTELLRAIDQLVEQGLAAEPRLHRIWNYIKDEGEELSKAKVRQGIRNFTFIELLAARTWFPARMKADNPGFRAPEARLYKASELYLDVNLVSSHSPVCAWKVPDAPAKALGFQHAVPLTSVLNHFDYLLSLWEQDGHAGISAESFEAATGRIYKYISRFAEDPNTEEGRAALGPHERKRLRTYRERPCLWDRRRRRLWPPVHVFGLEVPFFEPLRTSLGRANRAAIELLGCKDAPESEDFIDFLLALRNAQVEPLSEEQRKQALNAFKKLASESVPEDLPLLTRDGRLMPSKGMYRDDAPWLRDRLISLSLAADAVPVELMERLKVRRISQCVYEVLVEGQDAPVEQSARDFCRRLSDRLRAPEFSRGLLRLLRHHGLNGEPSLRQIQRLRLRPVAGITTEIRLDDGSSLGHASVRSYFNADENVLLMTGSSGMRMVSYLARTIQRLLGDEALPDLSPLEHILNCDSKEIDDVLDEDRITEIRVEDVPISWRAPVHEPSGDEQISYDSHVEATPSDEDLLDRSDSFNEGNGHAAELALGGSMAALNDYSGAPNFAENAVTGNPHSLADEHEWSGAQSFGGEVARPFATGSRGTGGRPGGGTLGRVLGRVGTADPNQLWVHATEEHPPLDAGIGRSTVSRAGSGGPLIGVDYADKPDEHTAEVREAALQFVLVQEAQAGRATTRAPANNQDYDIFSEDASTGEKRYIRVKSTSHDWRDRPVLMTQTQLQYAFENREHCWLYVVERLAGKPRLHRIKDPAGQIRGFRFDAAWASRAEGTPTCGPPAIGMKLYKADVLLGDIIAVTGGGTLQRLTVRTPSGEEQKMMFRPGVHRLEAANGNDAS